MESKRIMTFYFTSMMAFILSATLLLTTHGSAQPNTSQEVTVAVLTEPDTLDLTATRLAPISNPIGNNIYERLVDITPSGELTHGIASWEVLEGGKLIEFTLRRDIKFHNGDPLTTEDVKFSHDRMLQYNDSYKRAMRKFDRLEIIDDYKCRFYFKKPDVAFLPDRGLFIGSKSYYDKVGEDEFRKNPVGTGPYKFVAWKHGENIEIEINEEYWGMKPPVKKARFLFVKEDTTRVAMLKTGEADIILQTPFALVKEVRSAGFKTVDFPSHPTTSIHFNTKNPDVPWGDRRVRMAIAYAIDADAIVNDLFYGVPSRVARLSPWEVGYDPELKPYPYDPERAKGLLAEAGYPKGFEMPLIYTTGRISGQKETTEAVVLYLRSVGISCKVAGMEVAQFVNKLRKMHKDPKAVLVAVGTPPMANYPEPTTALDITFSSGSPISQYSNQKFDALLERIKTTMDERERGELIKQALRKVHEDVATISLWGNNSVYAMKPNIVFTPTMKNRDPLILIKDVIIK